MIYNYSKYFSILSLSCFFAFSQEQTFDDFDAFYKYQTYNDNCVASYYAAKFDGRKTASGEVFRNNKHTAAHKTLPFGTIVRVTDLQTQNSTNVVVNDRGPFIKGREIDLSKIAFIEIAGSVIKGITNVKIEIATPISEQDLLDIIFEQSDI